LQKKERKKRRQEIDVQVVSRFVLKQRIFKTTTYTSNKNAFAEKEEKRQGGREEKRKKRKKRRSEMSVFVI
jgi:hypothetical protein